MVKIHNIKFYKPQVKAIYCMALQKQEEKIALSRSNSCIEIWNIANLPFIERIISAGSSHSIQGLCWSKHRLFSCTLEGFLYEYDLFHLTIKQKESLIGEAAFCLDVDKNNCNMVVGTEKGYLNIFEITDDEIRYIKFLDKQEGRILCVKYDCTGNFIVSGSIDALRIWDVNTGHALHKMTISRTLLKPTIIWCIDVTSDLMIITGDSRGKLTFWDGKLGTQIESYQSHKADILSLALSEDQNSLFCAGVDSTLISYVRINVKGQNEKWVKNIQRKVHDHDVRSLILCKNKLYSAGIDGYLACSFHPPKTLLKYPPLLQNNCITICKDLRLILLQYSAHIEVWKLGTTSHNEKNVGILQLENDAKKLLHLERTTKNKSKKSCKQVIVCSSISPNGEWIAYSTPSSVKLYKFILHNIQNPQLKPIKALPLECKVSVRLLFTPDGEELILALCSGSIVVVNLKNISIKQKIETVTVFSDVVLHLLVSSNGEYLVASDTNSNIVVWIKSRTEWKYYTKLPKYTCPPTALAIQPSTNILWISYSDHKIAEYSLNERKFTDFSRTLDLNVVKSKVNNYFPIRNISFDVKDQNIVMLHDDTNIVVINKNKISTKSTPKMRKLSSEQESSVPASRNCFSSYKKYQHLVHLDSLSKDEIFAVEVSPLQLMEQLPPCLQQHTFGTK